MFLEHLQLVEVQLGSISPTPQIELDAGCFWGKKIPLAPKKEGILGK